MSKKITVMIPDNYYSDNVIERIKTHFNDEKIVVVRGDDINGWLGEVISAIGDLQTKLNLLDKGDDSNDR